MAEKKVLVCPKCHVQLEMLPNGRLCCRSCNKLYALTKQSMTGNATPLSSAVAIVRSQDGASPAESGGAKGSGKKRKTWPLVLLLFLLILLLLAGGAFYVYRNYAGVSDPREFDQAELDGYLADRETAPPSRLTAGRSDELLPGEPAQLTGTVKAADDDHLVLDNGVTCFPNPQSPEEFQAAAEALTPGDVVDLEGLVCGRNPLTLKYCNAPEPCAGGTDFYRTYDAFLGGIAYPDTRYDATECSDYQNLIDSGSYFNIEAGQIAAAYSGTHTPDAAQVVTDTYLHQAMSVTGQVSDIHEGWFVVEKDIYCFYFSNRLSEEQLAEILALVLNQQVTVTGYCTASSPDMTRMSYCTLGIPDSPSSMAAPQAPAAPPESSGALADLAGEWGRADGTRSYFTLTPLDDSTFSIKEQGSNGASNGTTLELTATYIPDDDRYVYSDAQKIRYHDDESGRSETVEYENGSGSFYLENGLLYWVNDTEGSDATGLAYEKLPG